MASRWGEVWPTPTEFMELAATSRVIPVAMPLLADDTSPLSIYRRFGGGPGTFVLESADVDTWSNWSFVGVSTLATLSARDGVARWSGTVPEGLTTTGPILELLREALDVLASAPAPLDPPLTGGLVGALGWDIVYEWEPQLPKRAPVEHGTPDVSLCLAQDMIAIDHRRGVLWLIANAINVNGRPDGAERAYEAAITRIEAMVAALDVPSAGQLATLQEGPEPEVRMRTGQDRFEETVRIAQERIRAGDIFQVVLSGRAEISGSVDPLDAYRVLRTINPSPYMYLLHLGDDRGESFHVVGSSPETLVGIRDRRVTTFPIAGSRPRGADPHEDRELAEGLLKDPKEVSEHIMLVDLSRNDLSKVCAPGTVAVDDFMSIKRFSHIMHICSTVTGTLADGSGAVDALAATFPAGTLSGAPKPMAISIIDELEPVRRGIYGGVIGYFDFSGNADLAIAIRTAIVEKDRVHVQSGAGIVADSVPHTEYVETVNKAAASLTAVRTATRLRPAVAKKTGETT